MTYEKLLAGLYGADNALDYLTVDPEVVDAIHWATRYVRDNRNDIKFAIEKEHDSQDTIRQLAETKIENIDDYDTVLQLHKNLGDLTQRTYDQLQRLRLNLHKDT